MAKILNFITRQIKLFQIIAVLITCWGLSACSPALNWRNVTLSTRTVSLPCKPDHGTRDVVLAQKKLSLSMVGCEAEGLLFAISHLRIDQESDVNQVIQAWQAVALQNMQSNLPGVYVSQSKVLDVTGKDPNNEPISAQLLWRNEGLDIYHWAVYGKKIKKEDVEPMFLVVH